jgi:hypothetical protein
LYLFSNINIEIAFKNIGYITDVHCMNSNIYVGVRALSTQNTTEEPIGGVYNLVFTAQWNAATTIRVCIADVWKFILLPTDTPHRSELSNVIYGGVLTNNSDFKIFNLSLKTEYAT